MGQAAREPVAPAGPGAGDHPLADAGDPHAAHRPGGHRAGRPAHQTDKVVMVRSGNQDEEVIDDPENFVIDRPRPRHRTCRSAPASTAAWATAWPNCSCRSSGRRSSSGTSRSRWWGRRCGPTRASCAASRRCRPASRSLGSPRTSPMNVGRPLPLSKGFVTQARRAGPRPVRASRRPPRPRASFPFDDYEDLPRHRSAGPVRPRAVRRARHRPTRPTAWSPNASPRATPRRR